MPKSNGGREIISALAAHDVSTIFGIPGTNNLEFYRPLVEFGITPITTRHEQGAGYAADGYYLTSGKPGVVIATSGPGVINTFTAAATAYAESRPMLILSPGAATSGPESDEGRLHYTKDVTGSFGRLIERSHSADSLQDALRAIDAAFESFKMARPRPIHIEIPMDILEAACDHSSYVRPSTSQTLPPQCSSDSISSALDLIDGASRAIIVAGGGSASANREMEQLVDLSGFPIVTTLNGKGVVSEHHPLSLGSSLRSSIVLEEILDSDLVIVVGSKLGTAETFGGSFETSGRVIRVDIDASSIERNVQPEVSLLGDARGIVGSIVQRLRCKNINVQSTVRVAELRRRIETWKKETFGDLSLIVDAVMSNLESDAIVTGDSSQITFNGSALSHRAIRPNQLLTMPTFSTLGYGIPAAIGAKVAAPERQVLSLVGDGAAMFSIQEVATAASLNLTLPIVIIDNGGYVEIRDQMVARGIQPVGVDLQSVDWTALAHGMGAAGSCPRSLAELSDCVEEAFRISGPTLIGYSII